jgi:hypothetical protein
MDRRDAPGTPEGGMSARTFAIICFGVLSASCATTRDEPDDLCDAMAAFANANDGTHAVRFMTDWGAMFESEGPDGQPKYAKMCEHQSYAPAQKLCDYLMDNTSTEFMGINARRAFHCMGKRGLGRVSPTDDDRLPASSRSHVILGARVDSELLLEFAQGTDTTLPALTFTAIGR